MTGPKGFCVHCKRPIERTHLGVREIHGYVDERRVGGANAVRERTYVDGRIWHSGCFPAWLREQRESDRQGVLEL